jgi:hypothetical protein
VLPLQELVRKIAIYVAFKAHKQRAWLSRLGMAFGFAARLNRLKFPRAKKFHIACDGQKKPFVELRRCLLIAAQSIPLGRTISILALYQ